MRTTSDGSSLNLVHCDISPPNVLVSFEGETKVIDFGIAKSAIRGTATDPKMGFGKFGYMAPEQLIRGGVVDHRTDLYAAGVVLFELLTGRDALNSYRFGTGAAEHLFCSLCGVKSFYQPRSHPDAWSVNAHCLDEDIELAIEQFDGRNWEQAASSLRA